MQPRRPRPAEPACRSKASRTAATRTAGTAARAAAATRRRRLPGRGGGARARSPRARGDVHEPQPHRHAGERGSAAPAAAWDDSALRTGALDALRAMKDVVRPSCGPGARSRLRCAAARCELARKLPARTHPRCCARSSTPNGSPTSARRRSTCWRRSARGRAAGARALQRPVPRSPSWLSRSCRGRAHPLAIARRNMSDPPALNGEEFRRLCDFLYRRTGIVFTEAKRYFVERRVEERMNATGAASFASYFARLRSDVGRKSSSSSTRSPSTRPISTGKTISCMPQHRFSASASGEAARRALRSGRCRARPARNPIRSRSGCWRTGRRSTRYEIEIVGSDIDTGVLETARIGFSGNGR